MYKYYCMGMCSDVVSRAVESIVLSFFLSIVKLENNPIKFIDGKVKIT